METYKTLISKTNFFAFLALLAALPYPRPIIHFCWLAWSVTWLMEGRFLHRKNVCTQRAVLYLSIGVGVWLLWNIVSVLWAGDPQASWAAIERYTSLLAIPLIGLFGLNERYDWRLCLRVFVLSCVLSVGVYAFAHYWLINWRMAWDWHAAEVIPIDWLHMDNLLLSMKHRMHYTNLLCMAFPCMVLLFRRSEWKQVCAFACILCAGIWMTGSRLALINLLIVVTVSLYWLFVRPQAKHLRILGAIGAIVFIVLGAWSVFSLHPRNESRSIRETMMVQENLREPAAEPRSAIWETALAHPQDYLAHGLGAGNATDYLVQRYAENGWDIYYQKRFSPHNQYLCVCMELGLTAAILFVLFWLGIPWFFSGTQRYWTVCALGICLTSMMVDVLLGGLEGIVFVCVIFLLACALNLPDKSTTDREVCRD